MVDMLLFFIVLKCLLSLSISVLWARCFSLSSLSFIPNFYKTKFRDFKYISNKSTEMLT